MFRTMPCHPQGRPENVLFFEHRFLLATIHMIQSRFCSTLILAVMALALTTLVGCSETPQEKYDSAVAELKEARAARKDALESVNEKKQELEALRAELNEAQAELANARNKVEAAAQAVDKTVTDEVLFRTIQHDVLAKKGFDKAAISVGVNNRVVTLTGHVPDAETHDRALKLAREQPGVKNVIDDLEVAGEEKRQSAPPADKAAKASDGAAQPGSQAKPAEPEGQQQGESQAPAPGQGQGQGQGQSANENTDTSAPNAPAPPMDDVEPENKADPAQPPEKSGASAKPQPPAAPEPNEA